MYLAFEGAESLMIENSSSEPFIVWIEKIEIEPKLCTEMRRK